MPSPAIVDSRLYVGFELLSAVRENLALAADHSRRAHLANQLLLYDTVGIPSTDLGIVPTLVEWLGPGLFSDVMETGAIRIIRRRGMLGYAGGRGINAFLIEQGRRSPMQWWQEAMFRESAIALEQQLNARLSQLSVAERSRLAEAALKCIAPVEYTNEQFIEWVEQDSYRDVQDTPLLAALIRSFYPGQAVDLRRLPDVSNNKMQVLGPPGPIQDGPSLLLRVADVNLEILIAAQLGGADLYTTDGAQELLRYKLIRHRVAAAADEGFMRLLRLARVPDPGAAVAAGDLAFAELWALRQSTDGEQFRRWLQTVATLDTDDLVAAYLAVVSRDRQSERWPTNVVRLAITTAAHDVAGLSGGLVAGAVDSFLVTRWLEGYSPKVFLDGLDRLGS